MGAESSSLDLKETGDGLSTTSTVPVNPPTTSLTPLSDLYMACKENRLDDAEDLLKTASLEDVNRIEPHGSTALHAASYYGHENIVKLLLDYGARRTICNNHHLTPAEEAKTPEIRKLFERSAHAERFGSRSGSIEWNIIDPSATKSVSEYKETQKNWFDDVCATDSTLYLKEIERYVRKNLADVDRIDQVYHMLEQAVKEKDLSLIVKMYTSQTGFYYALNVELASNEFVTFTQNDARNHDDYFRYWHGPGGYGALIAHHSVFEKYSFIGITYRGMMLLDADIEVYRVDSFVINKAFLSTSVDREIAKGFTKLSSRADRSIGNVVKYPTICTYKIRNPGTAFDISSISEYPQEKEVLIMPRIAFRVASIREKRLFTWSKTILIELHECPSEQFVDSSHSINREDLS